MADFWIVHEDARARASVARLLEAAPAWSGRPEDAGRDEAPAPRVVVLHVRPRSEAAFEAAERIAARHPRAAFVLLRHPAADADAVAARFDGFAARILPWPPVPRALRAAVDDPPVPAPTAAPATLRQRDALARRFAWYFGDLELADPTLGSGPLLLRGEPGTGRLLLARMVHSLADRPSRFLHLALGPEDTLASLGARLERLGPGPVTVCLEGPERLSPSEQGVLRGWIDYGPPEPGQDADDLRWIALVDERAEDALEPELERALSVLELRLPPLRERPGAGTAFAKAYVADWCRQRGVAERPLAEDALAAVAADAWPGNLRELEGALARALHRGGEGPLSATALGVYFSEEKAPLAPDPDPARETAPGDARASGDDPEAATTGSGDPPARADDALWARTLSHALRNPMTGLSAFTQLLPERYDDPEFREQFQARVEADVGALEASLDRLARHAALEEEPAVPVDASALLEELFESRRAAIARRRLLVLRELEEDRPHALAGPARLRFAFEGLLDAALDAVPDRSDVYVACRHHPTGLRGGPAMRVLLRFHPARAPQVMPGEDTELDLTLLLARDAVLALGGTFTSDATDADERVLLVDLPAP